MGVWYMYLSPGCSLSLAFSETWHNFHLKNWIPHFSLSTRGGSQNCKIIKWFLSSGWWCQSESGAQSDSAENLKSVSHWLKTWPTQKVQRFWNGLWTWGKSTSLNMQKQPLFRICAKNGEHNVQWVHTMVHAWGLFHIHWLRTARICSVLPLFEMLSKVLSIDWWSFLSVLASSLAPLFSLQSRPWVKFQAEQMRKDSSWGNALLTVSVSLFE